MTEPLKLGLAGLGTVGGGVLRLLAERRPDLAASASGGRSRSWPSPRADRRKNRDADISGFRFVADPVALARDPGIDVFVELIGGEEGVAKEAVEAALRAGKHVVTANKALLAHHGPALAALAEKTWRGAEFRGRGGRRHSRGQGDAREPARQHHRPRLRHPQRHLQLHPHADAERGAELRRRAEGGASARLCRSRSHLRHRRLRHRAQACASDHRSPSAPARAFESVYVEGIENITPADIEAADDLGYRIKLLGVASRTESGIEQRVHPTMVPKHTAIAAVDGVSNCVAIDGDFVGDIMLIGPGAGAGPTASSVASDLIDIARGHILPPFGTKAKDLKPYKKAEMRGHEGGYYIRLSVYDRTGAFAAIASRMAEQGISLESIVQRRPPCRIARLHGARRPARQPPWS